MEPPLSVCQRLLKDDGGGDGPWLVLSDSQRASLSQRGFAVLDGLAPASLAAEAYEEASIILCTKEREDRGSKIERESNTRRNEREGGRQEIDRLRENQITHTDNERQR